ncbi:MAG: c-type cytochrome, partial [Candidatus Rokuibacteriota bacterium]
PRVSGHRVRRVLFTVVVWLAAVVPAAATGDRIALGKALYVERCVLCHGSAGHGWDWDQKVARPPVPVPDLVKTVPARDDRFLQTVILDGGVAVGQTPFMPAFRFRMDEHEASAVIAYLRSISGRPERGR